MDLNGDGKNNWEDYAFYDALNKATGNKVDDGSGCFGLGCSTWIIIVLILLQIIYWIANWIY